MHWKASSRHFADFANTLIKHNASFCNVFGQNVCEIYNISEDHFRGEIVSFSEYI